MSWEFPVRVSGVRKILGIAMGEVPGDGVDGRLRVIAVRGMNPSGCLYRSGLVCIWPGLRRIGNFGLDDKGMIGWSAMHG